MDSEGLFDLQQEKGLFLFYEVFRRSVGPISLLVNGYQSHVPGSRAGLTSMKSVVQRKFDARWCISHKFKAKVKRGKII